MPSKSAEAGCGVQSTRKPSPATTLMMPHAPASTAGHTRFSGELRSEAAAVVMAKITGRVDRSGEIAAMLRTLALVRERTA
jgi:hypothetical protein